MRFVGVDVKDDNGAARACPQSVYADLAAAGHPDRPGREVATCTVGGSTASIYYGF